MAKTRLPYPAEFRRKLTDLVRAGRKPEELAKQFEPSAQTIRNWIAQSDRDEGRRHDGLTSAEREELARLRRENRQLKLEREILANRLRGVPRPYGQKHPRPTLAWRPDSRPLAFWRLTTP